MTRTERDTSPHALMKDKHSRSGMAHGSEVARKHGGGPHNWGKLEDEERDEILATQDAQADQKRAKAEVESQPELPAPKANGDAEEA